MDQNPLKIQKDFQQQIKTPLPETKKKKQLFVNIKSSAWKSNQVELYDYKAEKSEYQLRQNFKIFQNVSILRSKENRITSVLAQNSIQQKINEQKYSIFKVKFNKNKKTLLIQPTKAKQDSLKQQDVFLVINSNKMQDKNSLGYNLKIGDIIKFGYAKYLVYEMNDSKKSKSIVQIACSQKKKDLIYFAQQKVDENSQCKICYLKEHTDTNPLINPCICNGDTKYTHLQCLKPWVNQKVKSESQVNGIVTTFDYDKFRCEVCKQKLPEIIKLTNEEQVFFLDFKKPDKPYLLLKSLTVKENDPEKIHFICPQNGIIKVGRSENCDLIQSKQFTVSRAHAQIQFKNGQFYIRDLQSKFGTLIKLQKSIQLQSKQQIRLQYKNSMYSICVNKTSSSFA